MEPRAPLFSVVMATWGRGRHIVPSIESVLAQSFAGHELIVVGDMCEDDTAGVVADFAAQRVRWINLAERCGSQSGPNNAGIAAARGEIIAYLGHDDIWEPSHLAELARIFQVDDAPDFGVSGLINHRPKGVAGSGVMGIFTDDNAKHRHFFPPSCFAHRKTVIDRIGPWKMPMEVRALVDEDLLLRAAAADLRFVSTGCVTVHKFSSADRYLSYVQQQSSEQKSMQADLAAPGHHERIAGLVSDAKRLGRFMQASPRTYDDRAPGELARVNAARRGLLRPKLQSLGKGARIRQKTELCALDWRKRPFLGIRLNTLNPCPRFLLPFSSAGRITLRLRAVHPDRAALGPLALLCNGIEVTAHPTRLRRSVWGWTARYEAVIRLLADEPSVLEFQLSAAQQEKIGIGNVRIGFGIGPIRLSQALE